MARYKRARDDESEKGAKTMSDSHHLGFTRSYLEACTDLKLIELQDLLLRERPEDRDLHAVSEELEKRQKKACVEAIRAEVNAPADADAAPGRRAINLNNRLT
jgi:hypothetical protein